MNRSVELSVVIPALNEEKSVGICVQKAMSALNEIGVESEVVVADNGSTDRTADAAKAAGAKVVSVERRGYGSAYMGGVDAADGKYIIIGDADDSYNFEEIGPVYDKLREGYDLVVGNRFRGRIGEGAMPFLHRYFGTPVMAFIMNLFFRTGLNDPNCGMRGFTKEAYKRMKLRTLGMEYATEMIVKASMLRLKVAELPCNLYADKRGGKSHLNTWSDGWRHLRFMLLFSPNNLFFIPGAALFLSGMLSMIILTLRDIFAPDAIYFITQRHMVSALLLTVVGSQILFFWMAAKLFSYSKYFDYNSRLIKFLKNRYNLEKALVLSVSGILAGTASFVYLAVSSYTNLLPYLNDLVRYDIAIFAFSFVTLGVQGIFGAFLISLFFIKVK